MSVSQDYCNIGGPVLNDAIASIGLKTAIRGFFGCFGRQPSLPVRATELASGIIAQVPSIPAPSVGGLLFKGLAGLKGLGRAFSILDSTMAKYGGPALLAVIAFPILRCIVNQTDNININEAGESFPQNGDEGSSFAMLPFMGPLLSVSGFVAQNSFQAVSHFPSLVGAAKNFVGDL